MSMSLPCARSSRCWHSDSQWWLWPSHSACAARDGSAGRGSRPHPVRTLKITVLVTNVAGDPHSGDGEWLLGAGRVRWTQDPVRPRARRPIWYCAMPAHCTWISRMSKMWCCRTIIGSRGRPADASRRALEVQSEGMSRVHVAAGIFPAAMDTPRTRITTA